MEFVRLSVASEFLLGDRNLELQFGVLRYMMITLMRWIA